MKYALVFVMILIFVNLPASADTRTLLVQAEAGAKDAQYALAVHLLEGGHDAGGAMLWYERAARQGHTAAAFELGVLRLAGIGAKRDVEAGIGWIRQAAEAGHAPALVLLGRWVAPTDPLTAFKYFRRGADAGNGEAALLAALQLTCGLGVPRNLAKARQRLDQARVLARAQERPALDALAKLLDKDTIPDRTKPPATLAPLLKTFE